LVGIEEDQALLPAGNDPLRSLARLWPRGPPLDDATQTVLDALLAERLEEVVEDAELEGLERVLTRCGREHDERAWARGVRERLHDVETFALARRELHVEEDDV